MEANHSKETPRFEIEPLEERIAPSIMGFQSGGGYQQEFFFDGTNWQFLAYDPPGAS